MKNNWINVKHKLPTDTNPKLVWSEEDGYTTSWYWAKGSKWWCEEANSHLVDFWQDPPEPPVIKGVMTNGEREEVERCFGSKVTPFEYMEERSKLAHLILAPIYEDNDGDLCMCMGDIENKQVDTLLDGNIRNIYELIDNQIPLWAYYKLTLHGPDDRGFTQAQYDYAVEIITKKCRELYG